MHFAGNFHPEWGYLAPAPGFVHTARIVLFAAVVGATAGAGVVLSLIGRPAAEVGDSSVAARTLARPVDSASAPVGAPQPVQANRQAGIKNQPTKPLTPDGDGGVLAASESSASSTAQPPAVITALAGESGATDASLAQIRNQTTTAADAAPVQKKTTKKHRVASRYTSGGDNATAPTSHMRQRAITAAGEGTNSNWASSDR
jgi:hypothetical protein